MAKAERGGLLLLTVALTACGHGAAHRGGTGLMPNTEIDHTDDGFSLNPFRAVVRGKVLHSFERLSQGEPSAALALMDDEVEYTFEGEHALGGTRVSKAGVARWMDRLLRLLPGQFEIQSVEVVGWPWRATVYVVFEDRVAPAIGAPYRNHGVQVVDLEWGRAVRIHTYVDTSKLERALEVMAKEGIAEAQAEPITD